MAAHKAAAEEITVKGLTGVDMTLRIAGPGTRAYAFVVDWHIRLLAALAWLLVGVLLGRTSWLGVGWRLSLGMFELTVLLPAGLIYLLYHPVLELLMRGRTPGKRMAGARIVSREGATPGAGALLMRNLFRIIDALPVLYVVGLTCCLFSEHRVRIGDLAAGTLLVLDEAVPERSLSRLGALLEQSRLDPAALKVIEDLLARWTELEEARRTELARRLIARLDAALDPAAVESLDPVALHSRLQALLVGAAQ